MWGVRMRHMRASPLFWGQVRCSQGAKWGVKPRKGGKMRPKWGACGEKVAKIGPGGAIENSGNDLPDE